MTQEHEYQEEAHWQPSQKLLTTKNVLITFLINKMGHLFHVCRRKTELFHVAHTRDGKRNNAGGGWHGFRPSLRQGWELAAKGTLFLRACVVVQHKPLGALVTRCSKTLASEPLSDLSTRSPENQEPASLGREQPGSRPFCSQGRCLPRGSGAASSSENENSEHWLSGAKEKWGQRHQWLAKNWHMRHHREHWRDLETRSDKPSLEYLLPLQFGRSL